MLFFNSGAKLEIISETNKKTGFFLIFLIPNCFHPPSPSPTGEGRGVALAFIPRSACRRCTSSAAGARVFLCVRVILIILIILRAL